MTEHKSSTKGPKIAVLWRGDAEARRTATPQNNRFHRVFEELAAIGVDAEPAVYDEEFADEVRQQLLVVDGVLVWVDPIHQEKTRTALDPLLREVAAGPWVSAHPDVILQMGVKEVLYRTKHLGWGTGTYVYRTIEEFASAFPPRLRSFGPRVIKQNRGNGGQGVWKVEIVHGENQYRPRASCTTWQHARRTGASGFHRALRTLFRLGRVHHRSAVSSAPAQWDDPLLHGRR
jgi:hypothetical protein